MKLYMRNLITSILLIVSHVAVYQVSVSDLCDGTFAWTICLSVYKVCCGKTAEWIRMPSGMVSGVSRGMHVLDVVVIVEGEGQIWD